MRHVSVWIVVIARCVVVCGSALALDDDDILFYAPFDGDSTATIARGSSEPLADVDMTYEPGVMGQAVKVGADLPRLLYPKEGNLDLDTGAISCWVKSVDWDLNALGDRPGPMIFRTRAPGMRNIYIGAINPGGRGYQIMVRFFVRDVGAWGAGGSPEWKPDEWHHLGANWGQGKLELYFDGELVERLDDFGQLDLTAPDFSVGPHRPAKGRDIPTSLIDEFKIFRRPLTEAEVAQLYQTVQSQPTNLPLPKLRALPAATAPVIDGKLDDPAWTTTGGSVGLIDLYQRRIAEYRTRFFVTYDDERLYIGFESGNPPGEALAGQAGLRDEGRIWHDDAVEIFLAPDPDNPEDYYQFIGNHAGSIFDLHARVKSWDGNWEFQNTVEDGVWIGELSIPFADLGVSRPSEPARWRFNLCRDRAAGGKKVQSWADVGTNYIQPGRFGWLEFGGGPAVRITSLGEPDFGSLNVTGTAINPAAENVSLHLRALLTKPGTTLADSAENWGAFVEGKMLEEKTTVELPAQSSAEFELHGEFFDTDLRVLSVSATIADDVPGQVTYPVTLMPPLSIKLTALPSREDLRVTLFTGGLRVDDRSALTGEVTVTQKDEQVSTATINDLTQPEVSTVLDYADFAPGQYDVIARVIENGETLQERSAPFVRPERPEWLGNDIGTQRIVLPPWTPINYSEDGFSVWGRQVRFNGLMPSSLTSAGREILAEPMELNLRVNGQRISLGNAPIQWSEQADDRGRFSISTDIRDISATAKWLVEYDGMMLMNLTIQTPSDATIDALTIDIPVPADEAQMLHGVGKGRRAGINRILGEKAESFSWLPFLWMGSHERGLLYFSESEKGWAPLDDDGAVEVIPGSQTTTMRLNIVQQPVEAGGQYELQLGLYATPVRQIQPGWWALNYDVLPPSRWTHDWSEYDLSCDIGTIWNKSFLDSLNDPMNPKPVLGELVKEAHDRGIRAIPYYAPGCLPNDSPAFEFYGEEWRREPRLEFYEWPEKTYTRLCQESNYTDYLLWGIREAVRNHGTDGVYFDGGSPADCRNELHGCGWEDDKGWRHEEFSILGTREFHKRLATMLYQELGEDYVIFEHGSDVFWLPGQTFITHHFDAEQYKGQKRGFVPYTEILDAAEIKPEFVGTQFGIPVVFLSITHGETEEATYADALDLLSWCLPHAIPFYPRHVPEDLCVGIYTLQQRLGRNALFHPYWKDDRGLAVEAPEGVYVSRFSTDEATLICVGNTGDGAATVDIEISASECGLPEDAKVTETFPERDIALEDGHIRFDLQPHTFEMIWLE